MKDGWKDYIDIDLKYNRGDKQSKLLDLGSLEFSSFDKQPKLGHIYKVG